MTDPQGTSPAPDSSLSTDRQAELIDQLAALGIDRAEAERAVQEATGTPLLVLKDLARKATAPSFVASAADAASQATYQSTLESLGEEYVGELTRGNLAAMADVALDSLRDGAEALAETARILRTIPSTWRPEMSKSVQHGLKQTAPTHYENIKRAIVQTGIIDALEADNYIILRDLEYEAIPAVDLSILRVAGYQDPYTTMQHAARTARWMPQALRTGETLEQILSEGSDKLQAAVLGSRRKRWTGFAKLLTGSALAGVDIAGGVAAAAGTGPLAVGVTLGGVLTSCAAGVGMIFEGIGALRGE
jgi:hypothetical protein